MPFPPLNDFVLNLPATRKGPEVSKICGDVVESSGGGLGYKKPHYLRLDFLIVPPDENESR